MAPEYGATIGYFPVDVETLNYLRLTGRTKDEVELVERYYKEQGLFRTDEAGATPIKYTKVLRLDLGTVEPSMAGPKRPQDRVPLSMMKTPLAARSDQHLRQKRELEDFQRQQLGRRRRTAAGQVPAVAQAVDCRSRNGGGGSRSGHRRHRYRLSTAITKS